MPKNIHFFIGQLNIGGIETYLCRVSEELSAKGVEVFVWVVKNAKNEELYNNLMKCATVRFIGKYNRLSAIYIKTINLPDDTELVVAMGQTALSFAMRACSKINRPIKLVVGVFSQWEFIPSIDIYRNTITNNIFEMLAPKNVFFCTEGCKNDHAILYKNAKESKVSPLLINLSNFENEKLEKKKTDKKEFNIISVGRITPFKKYNYQMPYIVKSLIDKGFLVKWNVYGNGVGMNDLKQIIINTRTSDNISLHGTLQYSELAEKFYEADVFVGAGTSIIEASAAGVPALVALDDKDVPMSPGFFCNRSGIYTSDAKNDETLIGIEAIIEKYICSSEEEKKSLSEKSRLKAAFYSIKNTEKEYIDIFNSAVEVNIKIPNFFVWKDIYSLLKYFIMRKAIPIRSTHN